MAYDEDLADRIRAALGKSKGVTEQKMFGGIGFMIGGNMAVGVHGDELMVRIDTDDHENFVKEPGARTFEMGGRSMSGWLLVGPAALKNASALKKWITRGADYASSLPKKSSKPRKSSR